MKVLFLNNYDMVYYWKACQVGKEPKHHLWGVSELAKYGINVSVLPFRRSRRLAAFSRLFPFLGDLDQQFRVFRRQKDFDIVYSGHYFITILLAILRSLGLFKRPIVAIAYQSLRNNLWSRIFVTYSIRGYDKILCQNQAIYSDLHDVFKVPLPKLELTLWGGDRSFYPTRSNHCSYPYNPRLVISSGRTNRDYLPLIEAFRGIEGNLEIYGFHQPHEARFSKNVLCLDHLPPWQDYLRAFQRSQVIAIPILIQRHKPFTGNGLATFLDAIALSKPVVMTRNPYFGIDIEAEGLGLWAEPGDSESWQAAIEYLLNHPAIAREMGRQGRRFFEEQYNLDGFAARLAKCLWATCGDRPVQVSRWGAGIEQEVSS
jgi:glycosyltransferase involved in cell wall biosynthesis